MLTIAVKKCYYRQVEKPQNTPKCVKRKGIKMIRIVSDTSTLYSSNQAIEAGFNVAPLSVTIADKTYLEFDEISSKDFVGIIKQGHLPVSSQPSVGSVVEIYDRYPDDEILNISMAHGLSGTYNGAVAASELCRHPEHITVINSRTLCGPHRYLVEKAVEWAAQGDSMSELVAKVEEKMATSKSYLMPSDFGYLRRGGRLSPMVSFVGSAAGLVPIMTLTEDCTRLTIAGIKRGFPNAIKQVATYLAKDNVGKGWRVYISHADVQDKAELAVELLKKVCPDAYYEILPLSPAFITQGGPGCVAVQTIKE